MDVGSRDGKPVIALAMGDPAGISPELTAKVVALDDVRGIDAIVTAFHRSVGNRRRVPLDGCQRRAQVVRDAER